MKSLSLLLLLLICSLCHSQSKKDQIQILTIQVDSLNQLLKLENNKLKDLQATCVQKEASYQNEITSLSDQLSTSKQKLETCQSQNDQIALNNKQLEEKLQGCSVIIKSKSDSIALLQEQLDKLLTKKEVVVTFQEEVVSEAKDQDERFGNDSQTCLIFCIDGNKIDKYCDYGVATISNDITPVTAWLSSENLEKYFTAEIVDSNNLTVVKIVLTNEGERKIWARKYHLSQNGKWAITECIGDCK
jgi:hypothetical protein